MTSGRQHQDCGQLFAYGATGHKEGCEDPTTRPPARHAELEMVDTLSEGVANLLISADEFGFNKGP